MNERDHLNRILRENINKLDLPEDDLLNTNKIEDVMMPISNRRIVKEKKTVININSSYREKFEYELLPKDPVTNQYSRMNGIELEFYTADTLNNETPSTPYVQFGDNIYFKKPKYINPNNYEIQLTKTFRNIKSIRLLSVEIPNSINNITEDNSRILINIYDNDSETFVENTNIIFNLDIGKYSISDLIQHFETKLNDEINANTTGYLINIFVITYNQNTGKIEIILNDPPGMNLSFHLKFWPDETKEYNNLWYLLGFPYYHELNIDGTDKYTKILNNLENGIPARKPNLDYNNYIYLEILNMKNTTFLKQNFYNLVNIYDIAQGLNNKSVAPYQVNNLHNVDIFGKIIITYGEEIMKEFINTPKIFDCVIDILERLNIKWYDFAGNLVNFQNIDHSFTLEVIEFSDELAETNMNTKRGIYDEKDYPHIIRNN